MTDHSIDSMVMITGDEYERLRAEIDKLRAAIAWIEPPFVDEHTTAQELRQRVNFCVADAKRAARQQEKSNG